MNSDRSTTEGVGRRIRLRRAELGLSQAQLAEPDLSDSYISLLESGRRSPSDEALQMLASRLRCSASWLRSGVEESAIRELRLRLKEAELCLRSNDRDGALARCDEVLAAGFLSAKEREQAELIRVLSLESLGELDRAIAGIEDLIARSQAAGLPLNVGAYVAWSRCLRESGDLGAAIDVAREGLNTLRQDGAPIDDHHVELATTLVGAYNERGDYALGQRIAERTIQQAEQLGSPLARGSAYWNAMLIAANSGRLVDAEAYADRALALFGETDAERNMARLRVAYSWLLLRLATPRPIDALNELQNAERHLLDSGSLVDIAYCYTERARALLITGQVEEAEQVASRARELLQGAETAMPVELGRVAAVLANVALARHDPDACLIWVDRATAAMRVVGASRAASEVWREIGEVAFTVGEDALGQHALRRALDSLGVARPPATHHEVHTH